MLGASPGRTGTARAQLALRQSFVFTQTPVLPGPEVLVGEAHKKFADDGPHLIYLPERAFVLEKFLADVKAAYERHGRCAIAVSEGIHDAAGVAIASQLAKAVERGGRGF